MITDINNTNEISELNSSLPSYWNDYFDYEKDEKLHDITAKAMLEAINVIKNTQKPYIDSKILISKVLTNLGNKHTFHRQFNENHPNLHKEQVLGMQLYKLMIEDKQTWVYLETKHSGHMHSNATYFIPDSKDKQDQ